MEELITSAITAILGSGLPGAFVVALGGVIWWMTKNHKEELERERQGHQETREAHLQDVKAINTLAESVKLQMAATESAIKSLMDTIRLRGGQ